MIIRPAKLGGIRDSYPGAPISNPGVHVEMGCLISRMTMK